MPLVRVTIRDAAISGALISRRISYETRDGGPQFHGVPKNFIMTPVHNSPSYQLAKANMKGSVQRVDEKKEKGMRH